MLMFNAVACSLFIEYPAFEGQFNEVSRNDEDYIFREFGCDLSI
ncbi:hypothetical protein THF1D04_30161 [Vibrio owensii]|uniref:DUF3265 domain-containing protein n=1 Tax=Vibrio owensii TaxID=696485 RepID=A0AAU9Q6D0_9VIBR|nr:hypothetical protein THF1D04_30161 [Vibrio owensii]